MRPLGEFEFCLQWIVGELCTREWLGFGLGNPTTLQPFPANFFSLRQALLKLKLPTPLRTNSDHLKLFKNLLQQVTNKTIYQHKTSNNQHFSTIRPTTNLLIKTHFQQINYNKQYTHNLSTYTKWSKTL